LLARSQGSSQKIWPGAPRQFWLVDLSSLNERIIGISDAGNFLSIVMISPLTLRLPRQKMVFVILGLP
jgi:hypothetical protein